MNLAKKYKQLFEGKTRSNDMALLTERRESALANDIAAELKRNSVLKRLGMSYDPFVSSAIGRPFIMMYFKPGQVNSGGKVNQLQKKIKTVIEKELEKIVGVNDIDDYTVVYNLSDKRPAFARKGELDFAIHSEWFGKVQPSDDTPKGNILKNKDFRDAVETIADGAGDGENMTDDIVDELGDFYDGVYDSNDQKLIDAYDDLRSTVDGEPNDQAEAANKLLAVIG